MSIAVTESQALRHLANELDTLHNLINRKAAGITCCISAGGHSLPFSVTADLLSEQDERIAEARAQLAKVQVRA